MSPLSRVMRAVLLLSGGVLWMGCHSASPSTPIGNATSPPTPSGLSAPQGRIFPPGADLRSGNAKPTKPAVITVGGKSRSAASSPLPVLSTSRSNPGVVVCEPEVEASDADLADLGTGYGRWLHLIVGGQGEFGQTPYWPSIHRFMSEQHRNDLRLGPADVAPLHTILGVTFAAVGTLSGSPAQAVLTYQWVQVPQGKRVGPAVSLSGDVSAIATALPELARLLCQQLGVSRPRIPQRIALTPEELQLIGHLPWLLAAPPAADIVQQLNTLAVKSPLAGLYALKAARVNGDPMEPLAARLLQQLPENALVSAQIGYDDPKAFDIRQDVAQNEMAHFPHNYLFAMINVWLQRELHNLQAERKAADAVVRNAPDNPEGWLTLGFTVSNQANAVRHGRYGSELSDADLAALGPLYMQWEQAVAHAAQIDPAYGKAWARLATAATFNGHEQVADDAFWKAVTLDTDEPSDVFSWGLQMYQPKWGGDPDKLKKVAQLAVDAQYPLAMMGMSVASSLKEAGFHAEALRLAERCVAQARNDVKDRPQDTGAQARLADVLDAQVRIAKP